MIARLRSVTEEDAVGQRSHHVQDTGHERLDLPAPPVSIGMPVFNGAEFLAQALDSVLAQTYTQFELIVSDNASTDATPDILREYAARDARIRYIRQAVNVGAANNHSFLAKQARGRLFKWVCADDVLAPTLLADCVKVLQNDPGVALCSGRTQLIDVANNKLELYGDDFDALSDDPLERYRIVRKKLNLCTSVTAGLMRLDALKRCGYMANYPNSDRVLIAGLALQGKFVLLPQILFYYRWGNRVATPLKTRLQVAQAYRPGAKRPIALVNARRKAAQIAMAWRVPRGWHGKVRSVWAALCCTPWMGHRS